MTTTTYPQTQGTAYAAPDCFDFVCPHCERTLRVPEQFLGMHGQCTRCKGAIQVTRQEDAALPGTAESVRRYLAWSRANYEEALQAAPAPEHTGRWQHLVADANAAQSTQLRKERYLKAIALGCPWPYVYQRAALLYARDKDYRSALALCRQYFAGEFWKVPIWAGSTGELLDLMERLERRQ